MEGHNDNDFQKYMDRETWEDANRPANSAVPWYMAPSARLGAGRPEITASLRENTASPV